MRVNEGNSGKRKPFQFMSRFIIQTAQGGVYLDRLRLVQTPWFGVMLHKFLRPDSDPFVHDHPWAFLSIVLRGGYTEMRRDNKTHRYHRRHVRFFNLKRRDDAHYVMQLDRVPTWTLVFHGRRRRTWGFWVPTTGNRLVGGVSNQEWIEFDNWETYKKSRGWT
jgi:hypothetical protein